MSGPVLIQRVEVGLLVSIPETVVEANLGYLPWLLGENLAGMVDGYVMEQGLGYFPALDFFRNHPEVVDPNLLLLIDEVARYCVEYTQGELRRRLTHAFSHVQVEHPQCTAFSMPRVRPSQPQSPQALAEHYSPNRVKLVLILSSIQRRPIEAIDELALHKVSRNARGAFDDFKLLQARVLDT